MWLTDITEFKLPGEEKAHSALSSTATTASSWHGGSGGARTRRSPTAPWRTRAGRSPRAGTRSATRTGMPLQMARLDRHMRGKRPDQFMSKKGCSPDNSACEGFFSRLENEFFYYRDRDGVTVDSFMELLNEYIVFYNERRKKQSLGWMSPRQYRSSRGLAA